MIKYIGFNGKVKICSTLDFHPCSVSRAPCSVRVSNVIVKIAPIGTRTRNCQSLCRLVHSGRDTDFISCGVFICPLRSIYNALNFISLHMYELELRIYFKMITVKSSVIIVSIKILISNQFWIHFN